MLIVKTMKKINLKISFSVKLYLSIVVILVLPMLILSFYHGEMVFQALIKSKKDELTLIFAAGILITGLVGGYFISYRCHKILCQFAEEVKYLESRSLIPTGNIPELNPILEEIIKVRNISFQQAIKNERLSTIAQLAAGLAHDIRNPLTSIRGFLQLISSRVRKKDQEFIDLTIEELDRINNLIKDMLYLARPAQSTFKTVNISDLVLNVVEFLKPEANLQEITLSTEIEANLPELELDLGQIKQVLFNLIRNAFEALDYHGTVKVL
ncbi:MAG: histidine kinase dimerization/phospho-acceptor domain-containing protein, partial [Thermincolia bacterium]